MSKRRYGSETSKSREMLLDAAETLMRESGYAAVTSRKLASRAGLKPQLVHYYFPTMDELFIEMFRRVKKRTMESLDNVFKADDPLRALWDLTANRPGVILSYEFVGLANHRKEFRAEVAEFGDRMRAVKINIIHRIMQERELTELPFAPSFAVVLLDSLARNLALEAELGVHAGHAEAFENIERFFRQFAGAAADA
ncbi:MAG: TetR/AcrR family transcriptional regulator [Novosphingobium sp.]|nr:TetR/AcrR family transcriptional regulator [Novosphingobium sp.]MCP5403582.1 TetR/AcrR family transcriptional regulator [Novosphingobium sp.]